MSIVHANFSFKYERKKGDHINEHFPILINSKHAKNKPSNIKNFITLLMSMFAIMNLNCNIYDSETSKIGSQYRVSFAYYVH